MALPFDFSNENMWVPRPVWVITGGNAHDMVHLYENYIEQWIKIKCITGDRTANSDLCFALIAFCSEGSFSCQHQSTANWDLGLYGLIRKTCTHVPQWDSNRERKDHHVGGILVSMIDMKIYSIYKKTYWRKRQIRPQNVVSTKNF
jgi:hypothetical protein